MFDLGRSMSARLDFNGAHTHVVNLWADGLRLTSSSMLLVTAELPKLAFTFVRKFLPVCATCNVSTKRTFPTRHRQSSIATASSALLHGSAPDGLIGSQMHPQPRFTDQ
jgi:hypothetical protein